MIALMIMSILMMLVKTNGRTYDEDDDGDDADNNKG